MDTSMDRTGNHLTDTGIKIYPDLGMHISNPWTWGNVNIGVDSNDMQKVREEDW